MQVESLVSGITYPFTLGLYQATQDLTDDSSPPSLTPDQWTGDSLNSTIEITSAPVIGSVLTFPTSTEFVTFANNARTGDQRLTVVIRPVSCAGTAGLRFGHVEGQNPGQFIFQNANAIEMQSFRAGDNGISPVVWIGALLVVVLLVGAFVVVRRRPTNS